MKKAFSVIAIAAVMASCSNKNNDVSDVQQRTIDSMKMEMAKQQVIDSMNQASAEAAAVQNDAATQQAAAATSHSTTHHSGGSRSSHPTYVTNNTYNTAPQTPNTQPAPPQKKRWSAKATGALIGAGAGAITGAMIDGRKGEGAIVGGLTGAAAGLGTGAIIDANKKKKEQQQQQQR